MKRRLLLRMLGLAPIVGVVDPAKAVGTKSITRQLLDGDVAVPFDAVTRSWTCDDFAAECRTLCAQGLALPEVTLRSVQVPASAEHCGSELQLVTVTGRVVYRQWNRK